MEPDDLRTGLLFEVTDHRIANHLVQFFQGVGHGKYRLAQRFGGVAPLGPLTMKMISFMFDLPKIAKPPASLTGPPAVGIASRLLGQRSLAVIFREPAGV